MTPAKEANPKAKKQKTKAGEAVAGDNPTPISAFFSKTAASPNMAGGADLQATMADSPSADTPMPGIEVLTPIKKEKLEYMMSNPNHIAHGSDSESEGDAEDVQ